MKNICVFTGTRADYSHLYWLMKDIQNSKKLNLQILVSGSHLSPEFGLTYKNILKDGFNIDEKVEMLLSCDSPAGIIKSMGLGMIGFADSINRLKPDIIVVLGDRFEALAIAQAALVSKVPLAHIHGGETSEGAIDESIRHAITKLSTYHFAATEVYRKRILQLGENPEHCWNFGAPGLDHLTRTDLLPIEELRKELNCSFAMRNFLVTYHPATLSEENPQKAFSNLLSCLEKEKNTNFFFTYPNADTYGRVIIDLINEFVEKKPGRAFAFTNLGHIKYLSLMKVVDAVVGNSSSGVIEAPSIGIPTINMGDRQRGRLRSDSIIDCSTDVEGIQSALKKLFSKEFSIILKNSKPAYGKGRASSKIVRTLENLGDLNDLKKPFIDVL